MKCPGAIMEYAAERLDDLMRAYYEYIAGCRYIRMAEVYRVIVAMPSRRFWVSDVRATKVVCAMLAGDNVTARMRPLKREMFEEIFRRAVDLHSRRPALSMHACCSIVISEPAPKFYLTPGSAKIMICKARKIWARKTLQRLRRL